MPRDERKQIIQELGDGTIQGVTSCDVLSEGTDVPVAGCAILLSKTASTSLFLQQVGRVLRPVEGKTAIIIDMVGNYSKHGMPRDDREWSLHDKVKDVKPKTITCEACYAVFELEVLLDEICLKEDIPEEKEEEYKRDIKSRGWVICPECDEKIVFKEEKEEESPKEKEDTVIDIELDYGLIDEVSMKNKSEFLKKFVMFCDSKGWKKGRAHHTFAKWSTLKKSPDKSTESDYKKIFSESDSQFFNGDIKFFMRSQIKLWREFQQWLMSRNQLSKTKS
jgi:hypothetical protein